MKLYALFSLTLLSLKDVPVHGGWKRLGDNNGDQDDTRGLSIYTKFNSDDADGFCLGVEASICNCNPKLALGTGCTGFYERSSGLFQAELDSDYCIQAGKAKPPEEGKLLRLAKCDRENPLQLFDYSDGASIKLKDTNFCAVFQGQSGTIGDHIVLESCDKAKKKINWSAD